MSGKRTVLFAFVLLGLVSLACNAFAGEPEPGVPLPPPVVEQGETAVPTVSTDGAVGLAPTATLPGESTGTEENTPENSGLPSLVALVDINVRTGPGVIYDRDGFLFKGESVLILGQDPTTGWWKIECPSRASGNECWVSGGAQYTQASNVAGVPVAIAPPTPTPAPTATAVASTSPEAPNNVFTDNQAILVYRDGDAIWRTTLDTSQSPPTASEPQQVVISPNIRGLLISPDGTKVAYRVGTLDANELRVINLDGSDNRTLVRSEEIPVAGGGDSTAALIDEAAWLPDSSGLLFNTVVVNLAGPGAGSQEDLWRVDLSGTVTPVLAAGDAGGRFAVSPTGRLVLASSEAVYRANLDGSDYQLMFTFDFVNTASEYAFYPIPQWTADGGAAYLAVSGPEPFSGDPSALWRVPVDGAAERIGSLDGLVLFETAHWSPMGSRLAHVLMPLDGAMPTLQVGEGNGRNMTPAASGERLTFLAWSPDENRFIYADAGYVAVGQVGGGTAVQIPLPAGESALEARWLTSTSYLVVTGANNAWTLRAGTVDGETAPIVTNNASVFDVYVP